MSRLLHISAERGVKDGAAPRPPHPHPPRRAPGQRKLLDVVDADDLSDAEAAEMLQRLHVAEARHRIQQLNGGGRKPWKQKQQQQRL